MGKSVPEALRRVGVEVEIHDEKFDPKDSVPDEEWIAHACNHNLVIVKCDKHIRRNPAEKAALVAGKARAFLLGGNSNRLQMLRQIMVAWPRMHEVIAGETPPFVYFIDAYGRIHKREL